MTMTFEEMKVSLTATLKKLDRLDRIDASEIDAAQGALSVVEDEITDANEIIDGAQSLAAELRETLATIHELEQVLPGNEIMERAKAAMVEAVGEMAAEMTEKYVDKLTDKLTDKIFKVLTQE